MQQCTRDGAADVQADPILTFSETMLRHALYGEGNDEGSSGEAGGGEAGGSHAGSLDRLARVERGGGIWFAEMGNKRKDRDISDPVAVLSCVTMSLIFYFHCTFLASILSTSLGICTAFEASLAGGISNKKRKKKAKFISSSSLQIQRHHPLDLANSRTPRTLVLQARRILVAAHVKTIRRNVHWQLLRSRFGDDGCRRAVLAGLGVGTTASRHRVKRL